MSVEAKFSALRPRGGGGKGEEEGEGEGEDGEGEGEGEAYVRKHRPLARSGSLSKKDK